LNCCGPRVRPRVGERKKSFPQAPGRSLISQNSWKTREKKETIPVTREEWKKRLMGEKRWQKKMALLLGKKKRAGCQRGRKPNAAEKKGEFKKVFRVP